jgi:hypothetical protein
VTVPTRGEIPPIDSGREVGIVVEAFVGSRIDQVAPGQTGSHRGSECEPVSLAELVLAELVGRCYLAGR